MSRTFVPVLIALAALVVAPAAFADHHGKAAEHGKKKGTAMQEKAERAPGMAAEEARKAREEAVDAEAAEAREAMEETGGETQEQAREAEAAREEAKGRGDEMKARRDERKQIMEEAKAAREPGTPQKGKKPWWRFWEAEAEEEAPSAGSGDG